VFSTRAAPPIIEFSFVGVLVKKLGCCELKNRVAIQFSLQCRAVPTNVIFRRLWR
jgi:hypothetical protein